MQQQTVLIADPQTHTLNVMARRLRNAGFLVATTNDGLEARALARAIRPDAIVADCQIPQLSGPELCVRLANDPLTRDIPVILLTAPGFNALTVHPENVKCIVGKPFGPSVVLESLEELFALTGSNAPQPTQFPVAQASRYGRSAAVAAAS